jgi:peptidoglycan/LPS O-acetylase OafA/YrhL
MSNVKVHKGRLAELDGLRALAVVAVILFHCEITGVMNAGFFGVDMFFAISGFIITAMLMDEYRNEGDFNFPNFYFRRLKRLLPPMLGLIAIAFLGTAVISKEALGKFVADAPAALVYLSNWWQIVDKQDYFDTTPHVLRHLWSLAVEEQFYILWPPVAYLALRRGGPKAAGLLAIAGTLASTAWMWHLYLLNVDATDQNRIYLGADTHAMGLLTGAALGCRWNPWAPRDHGRMKQTVWRAAALAALALLGWMAATMNTSDPWLYRGAFLLVPVLTCVVAYATMGDGGFFLSTMLRAPVVQWFGSRSYSLYLVHWLVFVWMGLLGYQDMSRSPVLLTGLVVVAALSEVMYRCVELPFKAFDLKQPGTWRKVAVIAGYAIIASSFSVAITLAGVKPEPEVAAVAPQPPAEAAAKPAPVALTPAATARPAAEAEQDPPDAKIRISGGENIYALGDSVLLGAEDHLRKMIPGIQVDAAVGRQASHGLKAVHEWQGKLSGSSTVLVHLGTNGYINEGQYRELLTELGVCKTVVLINVHADRRWTEPNNEIIARMAHEFPNTHLVDWSMVSAGHPDYFVKDGIHLTRRGILAFTSQIKLATGGEPLPEPEPAPPKGANARRVARKGAANDVVAAAAKPHGAEPAQAAEAPPVPEAAPPPAAPAPVREREPEAAPAATPVQPPAPASDPPAA